MHDERWEKLKRLAVQSVEENPRIQVLLTQIRGELADLFLADMIPFNASTLKIFILGYEFKMSQEMSLNKIVPTLLGTEHMTMMCLMAIAAELEAKKL